MANPYIESLNKYAYPPLTYNLTDPSNQIQLSAKLCEIALMEGWHDHNDILNTKIYPKRISNAVTAYAPAGCGGEALYHSEENYLTYVLTKDPGDREGIKTNWKKDLVDTANAVAYANWKNLFNKRITDNYTISRVGLPQTKEIRPSEVQKCFNGNGIFEDIYILRDVAYGCWADDIANWGTGRVPLGAENQHIYNVQTSSGIYDPGPSLSYFSVSG